MITKTQVADETVVFENIGSQSLETRLVFEVIIAFKESFVHLYDLTQS